MPATGKRRALGQHFLRDRSVIDRIVETATREAAESACQALLEIGPGRGAITWPLAEKTRAAGISLILCERDRALSAFWRDQVAAGKLEALIADGDFLELAESAWFLKTPLGICSNLPYSAGTAILTRLALFKADIPFMVLMFQAEVAARIRAVPGTKAWGSLSIWIQNDWEVTKVIAVRPGAFSPPPEVDSEVILLKRREARVKVGSGGAEKSAWQGLLKACFAHRRKMLRSGLSHSIIHRNALARSGVDGRKRAEALTWEEWARLFDAVLKPRS